MSNGDELIDYALDKGIEFGEKKFSESDFSKRDDVKTVLNLVPDLLYAASEAEPELYNDLLEYLPERAQSIVNVARGVGQVKNIYNQVASKVEQPRSMRPDFLSSKVDPELLQKIRNAGGGPIIDSTVDNDLIQDALWSLDMPQSPEKNEYYYTRRGAQRQRRQPHYTYKDIVRSTANSTKSHFFDYKNISLTPGNAPQGNLVDDLASAPATIDKLKDKSASDIGNIFKESAIYQADDYSEKVKNVFTLQPPAPKKTQRVLKHGRKFQQLKNRK
tara:strand:+ start:1426 stop:2247 length:822 start_codon:yes stop_codon:yes gene_type:complete